MSTIVRSGVIAALSAFASASNGVASKNIHPAFASASNGAPSQNIHLPPEGIVMVQASGSKDKLLDARRALADYDAYVISAKDFLGQTLPDDDERADNQYQIVKDKIKTTVRDVWDSFTPEQKEQAMDRLKKVLTLRVQDEFSGEALEVKLQQISRLSPQHIVVSAEDRSAELDTTLRDHPIVSSIWDDLRNSSDPLVREAFKQDHPWTGKRFKEVMSAAGGAVSFLERDTKARKILREAGIQFEEKHTMRVVSCYQTLEPGLIDGLDPENGLTIEAEEAGFCYRPLTDQDLEDAKKGKEFGFEHYEVPPTPEAQGLDSDGRPKTLDTLRENPDSEYLNKEYVASAVLREFARVAGVTQLEQRRKYELVNIPSARVIGNDNIGEWLEDLNVPEHARRHKQSAFRSRIESLATLEQTFYHGEALVIRDPNKWPVPDGVDPELFRLTKNLEARLLFSYWAMLKPHGSAQVSGRPILVEKSFADRELGYYSAYSNLKTISHPSKEIWGTFDGDAPDAGAAEIDRKMRWDPDCFKANPENPADIPDFKLITEKALLDAVGVEDLGFVTAMIGTASSKIVEGNRDAYIGSLLSAQAGFTDMTGGGPRQAMGCFYDGHIDSWRDGKFVGLIIGFRTFVVSFTEGNMHIYMRDKDLRADPGTDPTSDHFTMCGGKVHVFEMPHMCQRQHAILGAARVTRKFPGGVGTENEDETARLHNVYVHVRGHGMFPGFDNNHEQKHVHWVNTRIVNGQTYGYLDRAMQDVTEFDIRICNISVFDGPQDEFAACAELAQSMGFTVRPVHNPPVSSFSGSGVPEAVLRGPDPS
jgi:hypothetical protein